MHVVMTYSDGDGCTYSCDVVIPIIAESPEAARVEFDELVMAARDSGPYGHGGMFKFFGNELHSSTFFSNNGTYYPPDFLTVDEWYERSESK